MTDSIHDFKRSLFRLQTKIQPGMPELGWSLTYRGNYLTVIKPLLFDAQYHAYYKTPDFIFQCKRKTLKEKEYYQKFISERQKNEIIAEKITNSFMENFSSAKLFFASLTQNSDIKHSFEYYFSPSEKNKRSAPERKFGVFMRNKNYEENLLAFNKIGLLVNDSDKNLLFAGVEINQTNEATDFFDKQIRLYNKKKGDAEKFSFTRDESLTYAPFLNWIFKSEGLNEKGEKQISTYAIGGSSEYAKEALNYKVFGQFAYVNENAFDLITKVKYKKLEMRRLNAIEETTFSRRRDEIPSLMEFYKVGRSVVQLKSLFNWELNPNMSLNGNLRFISDAKPYVGFGIKYNAKESIDFLKDSVYSVYVDTDYSLKTDVKLALNGVFNLVLGVNVQENKPNPYFNIIFNDNDETPFKPIASKTIANERSSAYSYNTASKY